MSKEWRGFLRPAKFKDMLTLGCICISATLNLGENDSQEVAMLMSDYLTWE